MNKKIVKEAKKDVKAIMHAYYVEGLLTNIEYNRMLSQKFKDYLDLAIFNKEPDREGVIL